MKTTAYVAIFALFLISVAAPWLTQAKVSGPSASGNYRFVLEDGLTKQVEFEAAWDERGTTTGRMTFTDEAGAVEQDPDGDGDHPKDPPSEFTMKADIDSLTIENNRALMSGIIRESSHPSYVGRYVQLVVEDSGQGSEVPDKLTWSVCQPQPGGWTPVDAEDPRDEGAFAHWWATDAEREDDRGIQSVNLIPGTTQGCPTFLLSTYEFPEVRGEGQIQVLQ